MAITKILPSPKPMESLLDKIEKEVVQFMNENLGKQPTAIIVNSNDYANFIRINHYPYTPNSGDPILFGGIRIYRSLDIKSGEVKAY